MFRLFLVRHGETDWNAQHRYQGHSNLALNQKGIQQAQLLAGRLESQQIDLVFSSDLKRAMQTAQILVGGRGIHIQPDERLREIKFGVLEGHTFEEAVARWPAMISKWVEDNNQPPENGERLDEFVGRVSRFYNELKQNCVEKTVLVVSHGGPLREIIEGIVAPSNPPTRWFSLDHASLTDFQIDDENIIINCLNDTGHLKTI